MLKVVRLIFCLFQVLLIISCNSSADKSKAWVDSTIKKYHAADSKWQSEVTIRLDSLFTMETGAPFNGVISITQKEQPFYSKSFGYSDLEQKTPLKAGNRFVIGSLSKQITAVIVLREYDKGNLKLHEPIKKYLPELTQNWANTITVHQLLTHTHGIPEMNPENFSLSKIDSKLEFEPGTKLSYSNIGFHILSLIAEKVSGKPFQQLATELFAECNMSNTFHPDVFDGKSLSKSYSERGGKLVKETRSQTYTFPAAGGFISTVEDMLKWNKCLHYGKLLIGKTYQLMHSSWSDLVRNHPVFGPTQYGYGTTLFWENKVLRYGLTGYVPGFVSMNYFYPGGDINLVLLSNVAYGNGDIKKAFYYVTEVVRIIETNQPILTVKIIQ